MSLADNIFYEWLIRAIILKASTHTLLQCNNSFLTANRKRQSIKTKPNFIQFHYFVHYLLVFLFIFTINPKTMNTLKTFLCKLFCAWMWPLTFKIGLIQSICPKQCFTSAAEIHPHILFSNIQYYISWDLKWTISWSYHVTIHKRKQSNFVSPCPFLRGPGVRLINGSVR